jgi:hypothetical protein
MFSYLCCDPPSPHEATTLLKAQQKELSDTDVRTQKVAQGAKENGSCKNGFAPVAGASHTPAAATLPAPEKRSPRREPPPSGMLRPMSSTVEPPPLSGLNQRPMNKSVAPSPVVEPDAEEPIAATPIRGDLTSRREAHVIILKLLPKSHPDLAYDRQDPVYLLFKKWATENPRTYHQKRIAYLKEKGLLIDPPRQSSSGALRRF